MLFYMSSLPTGDNEAIWSISRPVYWCSLSDYDGKGITKLGGQGVHVHACINICVHNQRLHLMTHDMDGLTVMENT